MTMQQLLAIENNSILEHIANISTSASKSLSSAQKKQFAAYFTPKALSEHMVTVANYQGGKLGDKGAGAGILSAIAATNYLLNNKNQKCFISACEIIPEVQKYLKRNYDIVKLQALATKNSFAYNIQDDFLKSADNILKGIERDYDNIIINPPYFKIPANSDINHQIMDALGFRLPNIYSVFILLSLRLLKPNGSLTALVPRSFFNGAYHKPFREFIKCNYSISSITRYRSRSNLFKRDNVLQENVIIKFTNRPQESHITIFTCDCPSTIEKESMVLEQSILLDNESGIFVLPADKEELNAYMNVRSLPIRLNDLNLSFSTGKVVEHRLKEHLNYNGEGAMYIEAKCIDTSHTTFTKKNSSRSHGNALLINNVTAKTLIESQSIVILKRISSNSDAKRMHCTALRKKDCTTNLIALSNTVQYIYGENVNDELAIKIAEYLSSKQIELAMRAINGTTQINSDDIKMLRFPEWGNNSLGVA